MNENVKKLEFCDTPNTTFNLIIPNLFVSIQLLNADSTANISL